LPASYVLSRFPVPSSVRDFALGLVQQFSADEQRFFFHLLASNLINLQRNRKRNVDAWVGCEVELPCQTIDALFGTRFSWHALHQAGCISVSEYSWTRHQCKAFSVERGILDRVCGLFDLPTAVACEQSLVNLFDGQPHAPAPPPYQDPDSKLFTRQWVRDAAGLISSCIFSGDALDQHLDKVKSDSQNGELSREARITAVHRYYNDRACAQRIKFDCKALGNGFYEYRPNYRSQYSGRLTEVGGGVQSCTRDMKRAVFDSVNGVRNYDLKASQAYALLQDLEDAQIDPTWLTQYFQKPDTATAYGEKLGISKDTFKRCLYATVMGAEFSNYRDPESNSIYGALLDELEDEARAAAVMKDVHTELAAFKSGVDTWHDWLMLSPNCPYVMSNRRERTLLNECDMEFRLASEEDGGRRKRRAAAFILQGREAAYVHRLTLLAPKYGFTPISNQHDGLVTIGEIPAEAQEQAKTQSGFRYARLEEKAFC